MDSAGEVDAEIILHLPANARSVTLPPNVRLVDWHRWSVFLNGAGGHPTMAAQATPDGATYPAFLIVFGGYDQGR